MAVALVHHPVVDKNGDTIAAAVTALDLHDIARAARTYDVGPFYVVTPLEDQRHLVASITDHWVSGVGARYNPDRKAALELIRLTASLDEACEDLKGDSDRRPQIVVTSAKMQGGNLNYTGLRDLTGNGRPTLLVFGTAWGLAPDIMEQADHRLAPIIGRGEYNHLAVRSAVSIIMDRMLGCYE